mmetsp:Transcript_21376/g.51864  ORF Transcript_21376/g.51864 Transcript_21376/m.51864 type:complete len:395 (-) Transcript_21376:122-1306(-)
MRVAVSLAAVAAAYQLRLRGNATTGEEPGSNIMTPENIKKKWDSMDQFLEIMFVVGCRQKHRTDVAGEAREKMLAKKLTIAEFEKEIQDIQHRNAKELKQACGDITANGQKKCNMGCQHRWGDKMTDRVACNAKCKTAYVSFEKTCLGKVDNLKDTYETINQITKNQNKCFNNYCPEFPEVYTMEQEKAASTVDTRCEARCTDEAVEQNCEKKFTLRVDFTMATVEEKCNSESGIKQCMSEAGTTADTEDATCKSDGAKKCQDDLDACPEKDSDFCKTRKKECDVKAQEQCKKNYKATLAAEKKKCQDKEGADFDKCKTDTLKTMKDEYITKCKAEDGPTCNDNCHKKCKTEKLSECVENAKNSGTPTHDWCSYMWNFLSESSQVDKKTGDPVV